VLSQLLHNLLGYKIQHTMYLLSRGLLSRILRSVSTLHSATTNHSYCIHALGSDPSNNIHYPFSYQLTSWFCSESQHHLLLLCLPVLPSREHKQTFFPLHLLHCYIHRSYQWTLPRGSEQACIDEPLLVQSCRTILLWADHSAYSNEAMPP
jgi:hypothetical protein